MHPVGLEGLVLLVSSTPSASYTLSASSSMGSLSPEGRDLMETSHLGLSVSWCLTLLSDLKSLYLFLSIEGESFSDDS